MAVQESSPSTEKVVWAKHLAWVLIVAMFLGTGLYVFRSLRSLPGDAVSGGRAALQELANVASAFTSGTVTTSFTSYATELSGGSLFQFAKLKQTEIFERADEATTLWGNLQLPEVVVRATAPVEYTYYLDLDGSWEFHQQGKRVIAVPPKIEFNKPAVDASAIEYEIRAGSLFRDEELALDRLKQGITTLSFQRAKENLPLVREIGRRRVEAFVTTWLAQGFLDGADISVKVIFADELEEEGLKEFMVRPAPREGA